MGGHAEQCDYCGVIEDVYHACKNRACPRCQGREREKWIETRKAELLPVPYFHVVFTVPMELRQLIRRHKRILLSILMKAAAHALLKLGADPKYVGGALGFLVVLHTWGGALVYHPHVHCLIPGGAFNKQKQTWNRSRNN